MKKKEILLVGRISSEVIHQNDFLIKLQELMYKYEIDKIDIAWKKDFTKTKK